MGAEPILAFDIETYGRWDSLSGETQAYLQRRDEQRGIAPDHPRAAPGSVSLLPGLARVVAIGLWAPDRRAALVLVPPDVEAGPEAEGLDERRFTSEAELLTAFWEEASAAIAAGARLVTFAGRTFDGPMLMLRSTVLGVTPTVQLAGRRSSLRPHCDMAEVLSFLGARRERMALDYWCTVYGIASPKAEMNGAAVGSAFEQGEFDAIARYALEDARAAGELYARLRSLLPLLEQESPTG